eukprot:Skav216534  [mRNA]  locus=scaffold1776:10510:11568:+ [translate_table: standard]
MAHFFGMKTDELRDTRLVDLLDARDAKRFTRLVTNSVQGLHSNGTSGQQTAASLNLTFRRSSGSTVETRIYLGSIPSLLGDEKPGHLIAFNEIREEEINEPQFEGRVEGRIEGKVEGKVIEDDLRHSEKKLMPAMPAVDVKLESPKLNAVASTVEQMPLNADNLTLHARAFDRSESGHGHGAVDRVNVVFDSESLAVKEISVKMSTVKGRKKTLLRECVLPQAWQEFENWLEAVQWKTAVPPVVPFVFPKFVTGALAARHTQICRLSNNQTKSSREVMLTLSDIRMRRFQSVRSGGPPTMGRGTASHVSRCSLDDQNL